MFYLLCWQMKKCKKDEKSKKSANTRLILTISVDLKMIADFCLLSLPEIIGIFFMHAKNPLNLHL